MRKTNIPYVAYSNEQLKNCRIVHAGDLISCHRCKQPHSLIGGKNEEGIETEVLLAYRCGEGLFLAALDNKLLSDIKLTK